MAMRRVAARAAASLLLAAPRGALVQCARWATAGAKAAPAIDDVTAAAKAAAKAPRARKAGSTAKNVTPEDVVNGEHIFIWDIETTGLNSEKDQIVEIGIFHPHSGKSFERLVRPTEAKMGAEAQEIHGIDTSELLDAPTFQAVWTEAVAWMNALHPQGSRKLLLSHFTASLDTPMLHRELRRVDAKLPEGMILGDSATIIRSNMPKTASLSLDNLVAHFKLDASTGRAHRALGDTHRIWAIFQLLKPGETLKHISKTYKLSSLEKKAKEKAAKDKPKSRGACWWKWVKKKEPKAAAA